ncbi:hypothetical protein [Ralstonia sp. SET104]|uniref:hypothetical protein n=1 Tax=Ralstonia sp. SET104 TaxID=2448774 RepID=UPI000F5713AB|nr:hypothetical protein [Ralstonia sp. SET104]GCB03890.1 hypothetical protein PSUB009319_15210 [Ralstonia sp. SET104]
MKAIPVALLVLALATPASADCVYGAKSSTSFRVLDDHTLLLEGAISGAIMLKSFSFFMPYSRITVLKDSFCDYATDVLYVNGMTVSVQEVKQIR